MLKEILKIFKIEEQITKCNNNSLKQIKMDFLNIINKIKINNKNKRQQAMALINKIPYKIITHHKIIIKILVLLGIIILNNKIVNFNKINNKIITLIIKILKALIKISLKTTNKVGFNLIKQIINSNKIHSLI